MINKYYSLDECANKDQVFEKFESLYEDGKIAWDEVEDDVIKIKDLGLTVKEKKELAKFLEENDVLEYNDYDEEEDEEDEDFDEFGIEDFDDDDY